ncbi:MAG: ECF-type sigma factor [Chiayiivirga sp.]|jgi:RNA polymerase sigma factor (TIGR02999 family)|uniref:ECF-type sigma factor n=1 Tax=Chiayiivirga sp. TaxID=2041042 RepID=UPI0025BA6DB8|nr:ECF-type sigma factor [Chiayiivirga sp.]MCI1709268.1 ECF-type sigma factor [Chiayiivirga sp.]MCI1730666.1 ECF-type sigma factor [Chiayiivirga sp.]
MSALSDGPDAYGAVYARLRDIAHRERRRVGAGDTLNTTALVHETYLDMVQAQMSAAPRDILAYAARAMRNLLIDEARRKGCAKRGGDLARTELDSQTPQPSADDLAQTLALDQALRRLADVDARAAEVVELHYFGGVELAQIAVLLGVSERTVNRDWRTARAWLQQQLAS